MVSPNRANPAHRAWIEQARHQSDEAERQASDSSAATLISTAPVFSADHFPGYDIEREIHRGAQGVVYRAIQRSTRRVVALKVLREGPFAGSSDRARFEREVRALAQLRHPHIVAIHDSGEAAGHFYLVMDFIDGRPLDPGAARKSSVRETLQFFVRIADAVNAAHLRGLMHRDLKPGNILVDAEGSPHVVDFGLAKFTNGEEGLEGSSAATLTGQFVGSLPWCSPEQADGAEIDIRTDVYSLGVLLFQMLTGAFPYSVTGRVGDVLQRVRTEVPLRPRTLRADLDDEVETILLKCLQKEPERRYQSASELARDLRHYLAGEPIEAKRDSAAYMFRKTLSRHRGATGVAAAFALVITAGFIVSLTLWQQARRQRDRAEGETKRAENALIAEAEQRRLADRRLEETQRVSDFQARMLREVNVEEMGRGIVDRLRNQIKAGLEKQLTGADPAIDLDAELARFDAAVSPGDHVDVARGILDEYVLRPASEELEAEFPNQPLIQARIHDAIGRAYHRLGLLPEAELHLRSALEMRERELGPSHIDVADSMNSLAGVLQARGDYAGADPMFTRALELRRSLLGEEHRDVADSLNNVAGLAEDRGDYGSAEPLFREALAMFRSLGGDDDPRVGEVLNNLAATRRHLGDYAGSESLYREALALYRKRGDESINFATCLSNLGVLLRRKKELAAAEPLFREALALRRRLHGDEHPDVATALNNLALLLQDKRDFAAAESLFRESLALCRRRFDDDHPNVAVVIGNLAGLAQQKGDLASAEPLFREALARHRKLFGDENALVANDLRNLGLLLQARGDYASAETQFREALAIRRKVLSDDHPETLKSFNNLGGALSKLGRYAEAEETYREWLGVCRRTRGDAHADTASAMMSVGVALQSQRKLDDAERYLREALAVRRHALGDSHRDTGASLRILAKLLKARRDFDAADAAHREALEIFRRASGNESLDVALSLWYIAELQQVRGQVDDAERTYHESLALYRKLRGEKNADVADILHALGTVHLARREFLQAEQWLTRAVSMRQDVLGNDHAATRASIRAAADVYEKWHAIEPDSGYDRLAAEWRSKLADVEATSAAGQ